MAAFIILTILTSMVFYSSKPIRTQPNSEIDTLDLPTTSESTYDGIPICTAINTQKDAQICSDGDGGAIIIWNDDRGWSIYAQRVNSTGDVQWTTNGIVVSTSIDDFDKIQICSDGAGGAIITWGDGPWYSRNICTERVDENGTVLWGSGSGIYICSAVDYQGDPQICSDGAGGAIITWYDSRGEGSIYAQRVDASGSIMWTANGVPLSPTSNLEVDPQICSDGTGGAIITWEDNRVDENGDIYAQRINSTGVVQWTADGVPICTVSDFYSLYIPDPQICSDGAGGAIITWKDNRDDSTTTIYVQKVNAAGNIQWTFNGKALCSIQRYNYTTSPQICSDGSGGAFVVWIHNEHGAFTVYVERIDSNGVVQWGNNGKIIGDGRAPQICSNGAGGAIMTWSKELSNDVYDIYAQCINSSMTDLWTVGGEPVCTASKNQWISQICSDGSGGAIITWEDHRNPSEDIYAFLIQSALPISNHPEEIITAIGRSEGIEWVLSDDIGGGQYRVIANSTNGNLYEWTEWAAWTINTPLSVPINRSTLGVFNYTIEFYDNDDQYGKPDTVIVTIGENNAPTSNHPNDTSIVEFRSETISWTLYDDFGGGQYQILKNSALWKNWTSWTIDTPIVIAVNTTVLGSYNYTILYYDDQNAYGTQDTVIVNIADDQNPICDHPADILTVLGDTQYIRWTLNDDYGGGSYRIMANNSLGNFYVWRSWQSWIIGERTSIPIDRSELGVFNYTIEYYDSLNQYGLPDTVIVTVNQNNPPTCNNPEDITTIEGSETIPWILNDDYGGGFYRVIITTSAGASSTWKDWTSWDIDVPLNVPIDHSKTGVVNYTIEYRDIYGLYGMANTVKVTIPSEEEGFPLPLLFAIIGGVGIAAVAILIVYLKKIKH